MNLFSWFQSEECEHDWEEDTKQDGVVIDSEGDELRLMQSVFYRCAECDDRKMKRNVRVKIYKLTEKKE